MPRPRGFFTLQRLYRRFLPKGFIVRVKLDEDLKFDVDLTDDLGLYLWNFPDLYEKNEINLFCSFIRPRSVVLDVGANFGLYTLLAAKRGALVFAIEADPLNAEMLRHNLKLNGLEERVKLFEIAATDTEKTVSLYRNETNMGGSNILQKGDLCGSVPGQTIDSLNLPPIDVCKMDIEGAEAMALTGMQRTVERSPNLKLFVEYAEAFGNSHALIGYLRTNSFKLRILEDPADPAEEIPAFCNILAER